MTGNMLMDREACGIRVTRDELYGLLEFRDGSGDLLGFYDCVQDETRDSGGVLLGNGNLLPFLLSSRSVGAV